MAARVLEHHKENPYKKGDETRRVITFSPTGYELNILASCLSPAALRCLFVLLARLDADGSATVPFTEFRNLIGSPAPTLSPGLGELVRFRLISKRGNGQYWVNPSLARNIGISL